MLDLWFETPQALLLLLLAAPLAVWDARRDAPGPRWRLRAGAAARLLGVALLTLALAQPHLTRDVERSDVIFVLDTSASIDDATLQRALEDIEARRSALPQRTRAGLVLFDGAPRPAVLPGAPWRLPTHLRGHQPDASNLALGLRLAAGLVEPGAQGRLVLLSDGRPTRGDLHAARADLDRRHITVEALPLTPALPTTPTLLPPRLDSDALRPGQTLAGSVRVAAGDAPLRGDLRLTLGAHPVATLPVDLAPHQTADLPFQGGLPADLPRGAAVLRATLDAASLHADATLAIERPPAVLIVAPALDDVAHLARALQAEGMTPELRTPDTLSTDPPNLDAIDLVILGNVSAVEREPGEPTLPDAFTHALRRFVSEGGGLITLGGDRTYDLGGWGRTELRALLPVQLSPEDPEIAQAVTMVIILDRSGSMGEQVRGGTKMSLTNKGAVAAMRLLRPFDNIAVASVDESVHWVVPLQPAVVSSAMERAVTGIYADGGGIFCYTSLAAARDLLRQVDTPLKHVILFSDAADAAEKVRNIEYGWGPGPNSYDLAREMVADGVTVSSIAVGYNSDMDTAFLRKLAEAGQGRFHITSDANHLTTLFVEETQQLLQRMLHEGDLQPQARADHPALKGLDLPHAPPLRGYIELEPRETATVALTGPEDHPLLTTWQFGLGQVSAVATDAGPRWAANWLTWDGYPALWTQLARHSLRRREGDTTGAQVTFQGTTALLHIQQRDAHDTLRALLRPAAADQPWAPLPLLAFAPGAWDARLDLPSGTAWELGLVSDDGKPLRTLTFATPPSPERDLLPPDTDLLQSLNTPTPPADTPPARVPDSTPLWPLLTVACVVLLPVDAFLRRTARG